MLEVLDAKQPRGELLPASETGGEAAASYAARYAACFKRAYTTERGADVRVAAPVGSPFLVPGTMVTLPDESGAEGLGLGLG